MSKKGSSKIISHAIEKWGKKEVIILKDFFEKIDEAIEKIDSYNFVPDNEPTADGN